MGTDTSGYSGSPLPEELGIKEGHLVAVVREPKGFRETLGERPASASRRELVALWNCALVRL